MARRRRQTSATGANMDSLLDALTNVVGILVIVLVAVQLSSQEAARRMEEMIAQIDPEEQERMKQAAVDSEAKLEEMKLALKSESEKEKIASLQEIIDTIKIKNIRSTKRGHTCIVEYDAKNDPREELFKLLVANKCRIIEMNPQSDNLEDIFRKLTKSKK